jgi:hypothetical protein
MLNTQALFNRDIQEDDSSGCHGEQLLAYYSPWKPVANQQSGESLPETLSLWSGTCTTIQTLSVLTFDELKYLLLTTL